MYTAFFGLREKPFALSPDPRYLFLSESHREALAHLLYGIEQGEGFITVTGEVGTGKTTLCRTLLERLGSSTEVAFLFNPIVSGPELLHAITGEFGLKAGGNTRTELNELLNRFLLEKKSEGRRVLLIVDEAQNLSAETLEEIRLLSNLETSSSKLIQILLLGQPELDRKLDSSELRQLRQRISVRWSLAPLSARETRDYVRHRLRIAAGGDRPIFKEPALREVYRRTRGIPRLINVLCDRSLLASYAASETVIGVPAVRRAAREIPDAQRTGWWGGGIRGWVGACLAAVLVAGGAAAGLVVLSGLRPLSEGRQEELLRERGAVRASEDAESLAVSVDAEAAMAMQDAPPAETAIATGGSPEETLEWPDMAEQDFLGGILASQGEGAARLHGLNSVLTSYNLVEFQRPPQSSAEALDWLELRGLTLLEVDAGALGTLGELNHPVMLELMTDDGGVRLVALAKLDAEAGILYGALGSGGLRVPRDEISRLWSGRAWVVWQSFEPIPELLLKGERGSSVAWLQGALSELGYYRGEPSGSFDQTTVEGVQALQSSHQLKPDGAVGPRTQMLLYDLLGRYEIPRLDDQRDAG